MKELKCNLEETINNELIIPRESNHIIKFTENNPESKCKKVILKSTRKNSKEIFFAFSLDKSIDDNKHMFPFFNQRTKRIKRVNDGILFYIKDDKIFILLIELKSKCISGYTKQLQAGKNFVLYLLEVLNSSFDKKYKIEKENIKCVLFSLRDIPKKDTTKKNNVQYQTKNGLQISCLRCNETYRMKKFF